MTSHTDSGLNDVTDGRVTREVHDASDARVTGWRQRRTCCFPSGFSQTRTHIVAKNLPFLCDFKIVYPNGFSNNRYRLKAVWIFVAMQGKETCDSVPSNATQTGHTQYRIQGKALYLIRVINSCRRQKYDTQYFETDFNWFFECSRYNLSESYLEWSTSDARTGSVILNDTALESRDKCMQSEQHCFSSCSFCDKQYYY